MLSGCVSADESVLELTGAGATTADLGDFAELK